MKIYYLTDEEIKNLKNGLMNKQNKDFPSSKTQSSNDLSKTFSSLYKKRKNSDNGHSFEENIKNILKIEYEWTDTINDTHFFYRIIQIRAKKELIKFGYSKKLIVNGKRYLFLLNQDQSISIYTGYI